MVLIVVGGRRQSWRVTNPASALVEQTHRIFDLTDQKDWPGVRACLADDVFVDFTSLAGGEPATITGDALTAAWTAGLHAEKASYHLCGNHRITVDGDSATVAVKGYAYNQLSARLGGAVFEVWGAYDLDFALVGDTWLCTAFRFDAWRQSGDLTVRTHTL
jgi:hypothetical protein